MNISTIIISTCLFSVSVAYLTLSYNFVKIRKQYEKLFIDMLVLEKYVNEIEDSQIKGDDNVHKENFVKFLSDSRDWAYQYIEDVQEGLSKFVDDVDSYISHFDDYGDTISVERPDYSAMVQISKSYKDLIKLLPAEEIK
jgi:hypothetical protein